jgi:hypothetical protein
MPFRNLQTSHKIRESLALLSVKLVLELQKHAHINILYNYGVLSSE